MAAMSTADEIERLALALTTPGEVERTAEFAHKILIASAEVIAACCGTIAAAEACYQLADALAVMKPTRPAS
jgi:hypothetical protein